MDPNRSRVKRALFGPVDHEAIQRHLDRDSQELEREETERMRRTYNFDPKSDKPLEGEWKWEEVYTPEKKEELQSNPVHTEIKEDLSTLAEETSTQSLQTPEKT